MARMTMAEAIVAAIRDELRRDPAVFLLGQDIGVLGGPMQSCKGLWEEFGASGRIIDAPISEEGMTGACVGAAMNGMRPVLELMFSEFLTLALAPLVLDAAQAHWKTDGATRVPLVLRTKFGIGPHRGHAEDYHGMLMPIPGLKVVMPATPYDAKGLMTAAIRDDDPVVFFEHMSLLHGRRDEVPDEPYVVPIGRAEIRRAGRDLTIVAAGLMLQRALRAAELLAPEGIAAEVVDLRTLLPLDKDTILGSVGRTGRLIIVQEAWKSGGAGAEIAAMVAEDGFHLLKAPIVRQAPPPTPLPFALPLEKGFVPDDLTIAAAGRRLLGRP